MKPALISLLLFLLSSLQLIAQSDTVNNSKSVTLRIDPGAAVGAAVSDVFSEVHIIPLETTEASLFGQISSLNVIDDNYVIYDQDTNAILIFTSAGKFRAKINASKMPKVNDKPAGFYGFTIGRWNDRDCIKIGTTDYLFYFDLDGKLIEKVPVDASSPNSSNPGVQFKTNKLYAATFYMENMKDSVYYEIATSNNGKINHKYLPGKVSRLRNDRYLSNGIGLFDYDANDELLYIRSHDYNIYQITPNNLFIIYRLVFPMSISLPRDFMTNAVYKGKRFDYFQKNVDKIFGIGNAYQAGGCLFFKTYVWNANSMAKNALIYNLKSGKLISVVDLKPDLLSQYLPITDAAVGTDFKEKGFQLCKNGYLYTSYSSLAAFTFKEQSQGKKMVYDPLLTNYFKHSSKKSNPILIKLKPQFN